MNNGQILNYKIISKSDYSSIPSERKRNISPIIVTDKYMNDNMYSQLPNYINPINYINTHNPQYPNYFTNYNTSNNYHINNSQQNFYYEKNNSNNNRYIPFQDNNMQNNFYINDKIKTVNRRLIKEAKENIRSASNENKAKKKSKNNYVKLDIVNCETQYPIMTCLNADPYNKLKRKSFMQNYNNINNYIINSNKINNQKIIENNEEKMNSMEKESLFNIRINNLQKYNDFHNSCFNFRQRNTNDIEAIKSNIKNYNDLIRESNIKYRNNKLKTQLKDSILNTDYNYEEKDSKSTKYLDNNNNNNNKESKTENRYKKNHEEKNSLYNRIKNFINLIEQYFISSFNKLYHHFLSQMALFVKEKIYENKNLLLKRFQRARMNKKIKNSANNNSPDKQSKLDSSFNNSLYIPKKQYKYIKPIKKKVHNINIITSYNNQNANKLKSINTEYTLKISHKPFLKRMIHKEINSVDKFGKRSTNFYNRNRSQDNYYLRKKLSPSNSVKDKTKSILRTNRKNIYNKTKLIYTKKRTNKFNINKKNTRDEILNKNINSKNNEFSFINLYGVRSPIIMKYKANERYDYEYNDGENDDNEDSIEQTIIKDICTYNKKFSVFIKYVTSQKYEQNYLKYKLLRLQDLYLNNKTDYIGSTHTDSIFLPATYTNSKIIMNEISEEKESVNLSNIQEDQNLLNKLLNMINIIECFYNQNLIYFYQKFLYSLKYIIKNPNKSNLKRRNNNNGELLKSKTYFNWKNKNILLENDFNLKKKLVNIDLINDIFKKSNSVKEKNNENNKINYSDLEDKNKIIKKEDKLISKFRINLLNYVMKRQNNIETAINDN